MENEATPLQGADNVQTEASTGGDDAALLSAYLAQEEGQGESVVDEGVPATQEATKPEPDLFTVKIDGVEKQVSRDELIAHYQKGEASGKRFEEAARLRQEAEAQLTQYQQQQQLLQNAIQHFTQVAQQYNVAPPDKALLETNPHEYLIQKERYEALQAEMQKAQTAQAYLQQQQAYQQQQQEASRLKSEGEKLLNLMPEWKNNESRQKDEQALIGYLQKQGYSMQDIAGLNTSRAENIALALKAMKYDALISQAKTATKKVEGLPPRVEVPGVAASQNRNNEARARFNKTGSIDDAAAAFAELFS